jgi:hypothetical protein
MRSTRWKVFRDGSGYYLATVKGKPSKRMPTKTAADNEAKRRNILIADYEVAVLQGHAGRLPSPQMESIRMADVERLEALP